MECCRSLRGGTAFCVGGAILKFRWIMFGLGVAGLSGIGGGAGLAAPPLVPYATVFTPGTPTELPFLLKNEGSTVSEGARHADIGQFWTYRFPVAPGETCLLHLTLPDKVDEPLPGVVVTGPDGKPWTASVGKGIGNTVDVTFKAPENTPLGGRVDIVLSAKLGVFSVQQVRFVEQQADSDSDGMPDPIARWMTAGVPGVMRPYVYPSPARPYTTTQSGDALNPTFDLQTDTVFVYNSDAAIIAGWKSRGYGVWTMGGSRESKEYAALHPDEVQRDATGNPLLIEGGAYLNPTPEHNAIEAQRYAEAVRNGSTGICPEEPEYFARAGYEPAFRKEWQQKFGSPWQAPESSVEARWQAGQLMAALEADHIAALLQPFSARPDIRRMVALHSPINYAQWGIVCPQYRITSSPLVQDVIGQVWTGTARTPVRYSGIRSDRTFSTAFLEYSSLAQLLRGTNKRLWFLADPLEDDPNRSASDYKSHYEETLVASLFFPDVDSYEVMPWPTRVYGHIPPEYATEINTAIAALQDMHNHPVRGGNVATDANIGVFCSDSMQWQRAAPAVSDIDGFFGLTLPLLQRGVPVQAVSLDRAGDPGYLGQFKTLLLSYDYQKPPDARTQATLADWVRRGGSLVFFGGSDAFNDVKSSWWKQANVAAPQDDLWAKLGISVGGKPGVKVMPQTQDTAAYRSVLEGDSGEHDLKNRRPYTIDLTSFAQATGSVVVRFGDKTPQDGWGAWVASTELRVGGQLAASFLAGSDIESRFLTYDDNSSVTGSSLSGGSGSGVARFADGTASWTYQFDRLPRNTPITLIVDMGNGFAVSAASIKPEFGHALLSTGRIKALDQTVPRLRIGGAYPATIYPALAPSMARTGEGPAGTARGQKAAAGVAEGIVPLYTLRSGGTPVWMQSVGKGLIIDVGVAPGFFSASERSAQLLRAIVQYAQRRAGGAYREQGSLTLRRGRYIIVRTFGEAYDVEGRTIDLLSPNLPVADDRTIPPRSLALLYDLGPDDEPPHIGFVSGRVQAKVETSATTSFFVRAPLNTPGAARLHAGGKRLNGAKAIDHLGRSVSVQATPEGDTVLLRYPNDPDGIALRVGWE
jgi:hypothetical protein